MNMTPSSTLQKPSDGKKIKIMLVDDSSVVRAALSRIIESDPDITVETSVYNGEMAVSAAARTRPDVIILDIEMPVMDGLEALPKILKVSPQSKVSMFSALTEKGATTTLKAMTLGAVECIVKPSSGEQTGEGSDFQKKLITLIKGLVPKKTAIQPPITAGASSLAPKATTAPLATAKPAEKFSLYDDKLSYKGKPDLIVIGSSTGGPQALFEVLKNFKNFSMPIVVTQHMPPTFTKILAEHITQQTGITAQEGAEGMVLKNGEVYIAPGGFHMLLSGTPLKTTIKLDEGPAINFCKPAVDPMFETALQIFGKKMLAVMLTGMGSDGLNASKKLVETGVRLVAQDEESSVVWGMPGAVSMAGICSAVLPLKDIGPWVKRATL